MPDLFVPFQAALGADPLAALRAGVIGRDAVIDGPYGPKRLIYADYTASGRALRQVEGFVMDHVLPWYANSHTEASHCGGVMTRMRRQARQVIADCIGAGPEHAVIFAGSGATAGINRLVHLWQAGPGVTVLVGPYEHHSNLLPWRESGADVVEIPEAAFGGPDMAALRAVLAAAPGRVIGAFSAASNVTGVLTDVPAVTRLLKDAGALVLWDYAGGGPYLPIDLAQGMDAVVVSPHKFLGGPGASGILALRRDSVRALRPSLPGGGTVRFVSPSGHDYAGAVEAREEGGTPNVIGDIRAALAFLVKTAVADRLEALDRARMALARARLWDHPRLQILGQRDAARLPIISFRLRDGQGGFVHQQLVTRMLSDRYGVQARGGCACAGPYVHRLLGIDPAESERMRAAILAGDEVEKPGFIRLNLPWACDDAEVDAILDAVCDLAEAAPGLAADYCCDPSRAIFSPAA
ncbi:MAG: aminotransferase class V-fold PLP-dependent enzyme [Paracoccus sp. (in: a-proteobacteria)]|uniref:aminotransferase class V-fold PLP-dependent enzyme n=1 Tax=Paracoccus sp. TaxID=267 RepID=UPI0026DED55E|nr:aminotransferase class V-fold PLP-dependent enzyme [Paracoccus sp. (in: a-proteobacteria)]MDO5620983.1 aminotransferase class V-fold PLP-dependent enzyme [Paracoccus sp. (in: a-proteobacteria)]